MTKPKTETVGDLRKGLENLLSLPDDTKVYFGEGNLTFVRIKPRGYLNDNLTPYLMQFEFEETYKLT